MTTQHKRKLSLDEILAQIADDNEKDVTRLLRTCTCPLSHQIAGVCPKLALLAEHRSLDPSKVSESLRNTPIDTVPQCTEGGSGTFECTCLPMHYAVLATCPKRKPELLWDRNYGARCREANYRGGVQSMLSPAAMSAITLGDASSSADLVAVILAPQRLAETKEAAALLTSKLLIDWSPEQRAGPSQEPQLPVNMLVRLGRKSDKVYVVTGFKDGEYTVSLPDGSGQTAAKKVAPVVLDGTQLITGLPHGSIATTDVTRADGRPAPEAWRALVHHQWSVALVPSTNPARSVGDGYAFTPMSIRTRDVTYTVAPAVSGFVAKAGDEGYDRIWFAWVIAAKDVWSGTPRYATWPQSGGFDGLQFPHGVPVSIELDGQQYQLLDRHDLARAVSESRSTSVSVEKRPSAMLHTAATLVTVDIALAILTCAESEEPDHALRLGRIARLHWLADCARVQRVARTNNSELAQREGRQNRAIRRGLELCVEIHRFIVLSQVAAERYVDAASGREFMRLEAWYSNDSRERALAQIARLKADLRRARSLRKYDVDAITRVREVLGTIDVPANAGTAETVLRNRDRALIAIIDRAAHEIGALNVQSFGASPRGQPKPEDEEKRREEEKKRREELELEKLHVATYEFLGFRHDSDPDDDYGLGTSPIVTRDAEGDAHGGVHDNAGENMQQDGRADEKHADALDQFIDSITFDESEVRELAPIAAAMPLAYVPVLALRHGIFDADRPRLPAGKRRAVQVTGSRVSDVNTVFVPVADHSKNEWLEAQNAGSFQRIAILGSRIVGLKADKTCTELAEHDQVRTEIGEPMYNAPVDPLPVVCKARQYLAARVRERNARNQTSGAQLEAVQVIGEMLTGDKVHASFFPFYDRDGNQWLQAEQTGGFERIALVGDRFFGISSDGTCNDLTISIHSQSKLMGAHAPTRASLDSCVKRHLAAKSRVRKPNEPREQDDRKTQEYAEVARMQDDIRELTDEEPRGQTLLDLRIERARAATRRCMANIQNAREKTLGKDKHAALKSDAALYFRRAAIANSLLAAIEGRQAGWAAIAEGAIADAPAAFGTAQRGGAEKAEAEKAELSEAERAAVAEATAVFAAVRGLHDPAAASDHAALLGALGQTSAGRIMRKAVVPTLPFGRALVAAVGAACSRPSFGRSYV